MAIYIKPGFIQSIPSKGAISFTDEVSNLLTKIGFTNSLNCCGTKSLVDLDYNSNADALVAGLTKGMLYHTAGVLKIVI